LSNLKTPHYNKTYCKLWLYS